MAKIPVIPVPSSCEVQEGNFIFTPHTVWYVTNERQAILARQFCSRMPEMAESGPKIVVSKKRKKKKGVHFLIDTTLTVEAYTLHVDEENIRITASSASGFFYATQTLRLLLPPMTESKSCPDSVKWRVPCVKIKDEPRFGYRGFMLDVSRCFLPKAEVLKLLDVLGMLKINKLHLHLVDDNGWRLEIKKYPRLTEVGAWRVERKGDFPAREAPLSGEPTPIGGFYTQEDMREIVQYAASKSIDIIPEIEMPAHTTSSIAAYPWLACDAEDRFVGVLPGFGGFAPVYCAGKDSVFEFLQDVIDELVDIFPSPYIHVGGDEATKVYWKKCPLCQARMQAEGIQDEEELQGYFMGRINRYLKNKGKTLIGWDELTNSTLPEDAVVIGWQGMGNAAFKAARQGHRYILAPARVLYLIRYQGPQWFEPRTYFGNNTLKDVYEYEPVATMPDPKLADLLMGIQACLWTEFVHSSADAEYLIFPRLTAFAERAWSSKETKDWPDYIQRLDRFLLHLDAMGVNYARSMFNIDHRVIPEREHLSVNLSCIRPDVEIRYTLNNSVPSEQSDLYTNPLVIDTTGVLKAVTFREGRPEGHYLTLHLQYNKATAKKITGNNSNLQLLINGVKGSDKHTDFEWCGWYGQDGVFTVDLGRMEPIRRIVLGTICNYGMGVHLPRTLRVSVSNDGVDFRQIAYTETPVASLFAQGIALGAMDFGGLEEQGRYVRIEFTNPGKCPEQHVRAGQDTWVYFDEIEIE